ncbi:DUF2752 domain-containing protein [Porphyromonas cangingivalis]|uniref:DUF2752 domain-containing protein n=1 Tax=Porphyromonas cangingivalis TaxID=36874 RepID=UPI00242F24E9|nr:DUF2752 domain-containing protein [Porphyromonas cangingivalis]
MGIGGHLPHHGYDEGREYGEALSGASSQVSPRRFYTFAIILFGGAYLWLWKVGGSESSGGVFCWFRRLFEVPCPSCGSTRAVLSAWDGHLLEALKLNPLGVLYLVLLIVFPLWLLWDLLSRKRTMYRTYDRCEILLGRRPVLYAVIALILINWGWVLYNHFSHTSL